MSCLKRTALLLVTSALVIFAAWLYVESGGRVGDFLVEHETPTPRVVYPDDYYIIVTKSTRQLEVYYQHSLVAAYPIAISFHGSAQRRIWADELTPEGAFSIASMQEQSAFGPRQMLLDTAAQSLEHYVEQYGLAGRDRLTAWEATNGPLNTIWEVYLFNDVYPDYPIWNDILIHGGGSAPDWTLGCVALDDADVIDLFDILLQSRERGIGVLVEIRP